MILRILTLVMILSPLWPFGQNPTLNAPLIIVNTNLNQLAHIDKGEVQTVYSVATGVSQEQTPDGLHTITVKAENPYYRKKNIPGGTPENPLGTRWIGFDAKETDGRIYGIHGTNQPESIGEHRSSGCIRMHNEEVEELFDQIIIGTKVWIVSTEEDFETLAKDIGAIP